MLTHVDENHQPTMVDVTAKESTLRMATAQTCIRFPEELRVHVRDGEIYLKKGPVFQTALIAGTIAVKKTSDAIPFCHQIPVEGCTFTFDVDDELVCRITCTVKTNFKTGVEMEALHGVMIAALTVYDMCKALSHQIVIEDTKLIAKTGGKKPILGRPLYGLVLTGGKSTRMNRDKALIAYHGVAHAKYIYDVMSPFCAEVYLSAKTHQWEGTELAKLPTIDDVVDAHGPVSGILSAMAKYPEADWLVAACDLVHFNGETVATLLAHYNQDAVAVCFKNVTEGFPEPLCAIYTPRARVVFEEARLADIRCPVKILKTADCRLVSQTGSINLANINTPDEFAEVHH